MTTRCHDNAALHLAFPGDAGILPATVARKRDLPWEVRLPAAHRIALPGARTARPPTSRPWTRGLKLRFVPIPPLTLRVPPRDVRETTSTTWENNSSSTQSAKGNTWRTGRPRSGIPAQSGACSRAGEGRASSRPPSDGRMSGCPVVPMVDVRMTAHCHGNAALSLASPGDAGILPATVARVPLGTRASCPRRPGRSQVLPWGRGHLARDGRAKARPPMGGAASSRAKHRPLPECASV